MIEWHFFDKVLRTWLNYVECSFEDFVKLMERLGYNDVANLHDGNGFCIDFNESNNSKGNNFLLLWLKKYDTATLVHELGHLTMFVFDDRGIPIRTENTEIFSYYQEFWFNEIMRARRRKPQGIKPSEVSR